MGWDLATELPSGPRRHLGSWAPGLPIRASKSEVLAAPQSLAYSAEWVPCFLALGGPSSGAMAVGVAVISGCRCPTTQPAQTTPPGGGLPWQEAVSLFPPVLWVPVSRAAAEPTPRWVADRQTRAA